MTMNNILDIVEETKETCPRCSNPYKFPVKAKSYEPLKLVVQYIRCPTCRWSRIISIRTRRGYKLEQKILKKYGVARSAQDYEVLKRAKRQLDVDTYANVEDIKWLESKITEDAAFKKFLKGEGVGDSN